MRIIVSTTISLIIFLFVAVSAQAEIRYVTDQLFLTLRAGKSQQHRIIKTLKTDTPVEILDDSDATYLKVKTLDGKTGYVMKQYITKEKPKSMVISQLEKEKERAGQEIENLKKRISGLTKGISSEKEELNTKLSEFSRKNNSLKKELTASNRELKELKENYEELRLQSGNLDEIVSERNRLREKNTNLLNEVQKLENRNSKLKNLAMLRWFLAGGGVFLVGWLIGRTNRRKKIRW